MTTIDQSWRQSLLHADANIGQAISNLDSVGIQIILVIDNEGTLVGTISDGDIRRGLLKGLDLTSPIRSVIHRKPVVVPPEVERELVLQLMAVNKVRQIPVVDTGCKVVGLHLWDEIALPAERTNLFVIMAGGLGTRLRPQTENCPKPMLPVGGKPMLEHIIERAKIEGFRHFVLAINYLGEMIESHFGDGANFDVEIEYLREDAALGTAGALSDIHYGEVLDFHSRYEAAATMAVRLHEWQHPFGVVQTDGVEIIGFEEKPVARSHINAGIYALDPSALSLLGRAQQCDMPTLFERLRLGGKRTVAFPMHEPWLDVGRPEDLNQLTGDMKSERSLISRGKNTNAKN